MVNLHDNITTLVDVTIASHNAQTAAADYTVGQAAAARTIDKRRAYDRDFETTNPNVNLVIFAIEDSGAVHPEAARTKSVTTARDLLSVDALPPQPYITGILPIVPLPAWLAPDVHPRRFAVIPSYTRTHGLSDPVDPTYHISTIPSQHTP